MAREIVIKFVADTKEFNAAVDAAKRKLESAASGGAQQFNGMKSAISASTVAVTAFGLAGVAALRSIGSAALDAAIKIDRQVSALKALTGSAEAAKKRFEELFKLAQATPGLTTALATSLDAQLRVLNVTEQTINRILPAIGRLNAISPIEDPRRFAQNLGQLVVNNFQTRDLRELFNASPIAGQLIKEIFNVNSPTNAEAIRAAAKRLGITTLERFAEEFAKAAENNSAVKNAVESIGTQFDKLKDRLDVALAPLGKELAEFILPTFKELIPLAEDFGRTLVKYLKENREEISQFRKAIVDLAAAFTGLGKISIPILGQIAQAAANGVGFYADLANAIQGDFSFSNSSKNFGNFFRDSTATGVGAQNVPSRFSLLGAKPKIGGLTSGATLGGGGTRARATKKPPKDLLSAAFVKTQQFDLKGGQKDIEDHMADLARVEIQRQKDEVEAFTGIVRAIQEGEAKRAREVEQATNILERTSRRELTRSGRFISDAVNRGQITAGEAELLQQGAAGAFAARQRGVLAQRTAQGADQNVLDDLSDEIDLFDRLSRSISNTERFMRGFNSQVESIGDAFDRFGANVARAFGNVKTLFEGLKQAVLGFFNDLLGNALQNLVRGTLGGLFGKVGGIFGSPAAALGGLGGGTFGGSVFSQAGGISAPGSISAGLGGIFGGGGGARNGQFTLDPVTARELGISTGASKFSFSGLGQSLAGAAPFLGLGLGGSLGGKSIAGNILGSAGGFLGGAFLAASVTPGLFSAGAAALFSNPLTAIAGAGLLVGSLLLGKASQRKKDEQASGEFLAQALAGIDQLANQISSDQIDGSQARAIFDSQILNVFKQQIGTLKTASVVKSRLTNQVHDLEAVYQARIPGQIIAQQQRRATAQQNAITHSKLIPEFATGGTTGGGLALLHPGEKVLNLQQQAAVRSMAGPSIFEMAGVPGINRTGSFDIGGTVPAGQSGGQTIVIDNLTIGVGMSKSGAEEIFVVGGSGTKGQRVIVNSLKNAKTNREL